MANIPLQSITFPGLPDKYTTPTVDATLTQTGAAADAKKTGDEIGAIKNDLNQFPNGTYPNMSVGNADQLTATVGIEDNAPYLFRTSGGSNDIGDREDVRKIVGGSVPWNQLVDFDNISLGNTVTRTDNNAFSVKYTAPNAQSRSVLGSVNITSGHKFLFVYDVTRVNQTVNCSFNVYMPTLGQYYNAAFGNTSKSVIRQINDSIVQLWQNNVVQDAEYDIDFTYQITDLTLTLGTSIADYVYSLETATAGAGVAWLKKHFPKQFDSGYQAYDAGSMQSVSGLTAHKMVGFNLFNSEAGTVRIIGGMQYQITGTYTALSLDGTAITPDSNGKFTPTNNGTLTVTGGNATDTCVHFVWDGEKDGTYEPYKTWSYALDDSVVIRGIPKLDSNNELYYDGDRYLPDGTVQRRYGVVDLGTLNWTYFNFEGHLRFAASLSAKAGTMNLMCTKYKTVSYGDAFNNLTVGISIHTDGSQVAVYDPTYTDAATFKASLSGVMLVYELAEPATETALPYQATQIVDDWGTEEYVLADGAFPVPVGHDTMYQNNLRAKLEMSPDSPDGDGLYVVQQESGENTYVPLASTATIQDILTRLTALENA